MGHGAKGARFWAVMVTGAVLAGCGGEAEETGAAAPGETPAATPPAAGAPAPAAAAGGAAEGEQIFASSGVCFTCHGPGGVGTPLAPNLTDNVWVNFSARPTEDEMVQLIKTGVPTPKEHPAPMPPMGGAQLTDDQVRAVAQYVLSLSSA